MPAFPKATIRRTKTETKRKRLHTSNKFSKDLITDSTAILSLDKNASFINEEESDKDSEGITTPRETIVFENFPDIAEVLGNVPDVANLSLDSLVEEEEDLGGESKISLSQDQGRFLNPLWGSEEEEEEQSIVNIELDDGIEEDDEEDSYDTDLYSVMDEDMQDAFGKDDDQFERLLNQLNESKIDFILPDVDLLAREAEERAKDAHARRFLEHLINSVVNEAETLDAAKVLQRNLNKVQIVDRIVKVWNEFQKERRVRQFLNRKTTDFYRRRKALNKLSADNPFTYEEDTKRYSTVLANLDSMMGKEHVISEQIKNRLEELSKELEEAEEKNEIAYNNLEELILNTVGRTVRSRQSAAFKISSIRKVHNELSKTRLSLIEKQHTEAILRHKLTALEDISDDLHMRQYEYLQTEVLSLNRKVEERNAELDKLQMQSRDDLHIHAHLREKIQMVSANLGLNEKILEELIQQRKYDRQHLYNVKLQRQATRKKIEDLSFEAGLLDKPILMHDYDETINQIKAARLNISKMKSKLHFFTEKIKVLELNCPHPSSIKSKIFRA